MSDHARALAWRAFCSDQTEANAFQWAMLELRARGAEVHDPPAADVPLEQFKAHLRFLSPGSLNRITGALYSVAVRQAKEANGYSEGVRQSLEKRVWLVRDLADASPGHDGLGKYGCGECTKTAAAFFLRSLGVYRAPWEEWLVRAAVVFPGSTEQTRQAAAQWAERQAKAKLADNLDEALAHQAEINAAAGLT